MTDSKTTPPDGSTVEDNTKAASSKVAMTLSDGTEVTQAEIDKVGGKSSWCFKNAVSAVAGPEGRHTKYVGGNKRF